MENAFQEFGIEARIISVKGPRLEGRDSIQFPLNIREEKNITLDEN